jgi:PAS domain S-box-containing protein
MDEQNTPAPDGRGDISDDTPLYNSRIVKVYLEYLRRHHSAVDIDAILDHSRMTRSEIEDPAHWFSQNQTDRLHDILVKKTGNPDISRLAGRYTASTEGLGPIRQYTVGLMRPASVYGVVGNLYNRMSRGATVESTTVKANQVEITATPRPGVKEKPYQCENRLGTFESLGRVFTGTFARVDHPLCFHRGDPCCRYRIVWEKTPAVAWQMARKYAALLTVLAAPLLFIFLPIHIALGVLLVLVMATLSLTGVAFAREKRALIETIQNQGDAAKAHLEEIHIRYDNALLAQELGRATSTIMNIDDLLHSMMQIVEKRLDFDRGMIMRVNPEMTRLAYVAGFGYPMEKEGVLRRTQFHLDNPESRGPFVLAFREQRPFLIDDIDAHLEMFSERSAALAVEMGVQAMICVPIVYKGDSLGVLAVDNIASKRPLTESDVNLLIGVASQTAISIVNAVAFEKLRESEKQYRDLVENANSIILRSDMDGRILFFNEFAQTFFGYSEAEIVNENIVGTILPPTPTAASQLKSLHRRLQQHPDRRIVGEAENQKRNGETAFIAWTYKPIFDPDGRLAEVLAIGNDVTELKRSDREKTELEAQLRHAQKMEAIGTLTSGVAHNFRNILSGISLNSQVLEIKYGDDPELLDIATRIGDNVRRGAQLIDELMLFSRKQKKRYKEELDLADVIQGVYDLISKSFDKMIRIELDLQGSLPVVGDDASLRHVVMNLSTNARDAMPEGGTLRIRARRKADVALLTLSDTGIGMDGEIRGKCFDPFYTTKAVNKGTGLGLSTTYGIIKDHGGKIRMDSEIGRGTTFEIEFPLSPPATVVSPPPGERIASGAGEKLLIVDDETEILKPIQEVLEMTGYRVSVAENAEVALEVYGAWQPDLVMIDRNMPGMDGFACAERILKVDPRARVLIVSGYDEHWPESLDPAVKNAIKGYLTKPLDLTELRVVIARLLRQ